MPKNENITKKLMLLPDAPGVYKMKNGQGEIIYVGKAISLRRRVQSYFRKSTKHTEKISRMVYEAVDFEYIITDTEHEALILECTLIKEYMPYYNTLLKDSKDYPYIRLGIKEQFPTLSFARGRDNDAMYFGPYLSSQFVFDTITALKDFYSLKHCENPNPKHGPCLYYYIDKCQGFCTKEIDREKYSKDIEEIIAFLNGKNSRIIDELKIKMMEFSEKMEFEKAAEIRDSINTLSKIGYGQKIVVGNKNQDIIAFAWGKDEVIIFVLFVRNGRMIGSKQYELNSSYKNDIDERFDIDETIYSFLTQFYIDKPFIPDEIIIKGEFSNSVLVEEWLSNKKGKKVKIVFPKIGHKNQLVNMASKNAMDIMRKKITAVNQKVSRAEASMNDLMHYLQLDKYPKRIEGFDISHFQGKETVASMVVFEDGKPKKKDYRRFRIKSVEGVNDFASMQEVIERRFLRGVKEKNSDNDKGSFSNFPDLLLVDGGKGQLSMAREIMHKLGVDDIKTIGLAKRLEEVFIEGQSYPIIIPKDAAALQLLQQVRDEAHRFAITYHRTLRNKRSLHSVLDDIPGIGNKRKSILMKKYGSLKNIREAGYDELSAIQGMTKKSAQAIVDYIGKFEE